MQVNVKQKPAVFFRGSINQLAVSFITLLFFAFASDLVFAKPPTSPVAIEIQQPLSFQAESADVELQIIGDQGVRVHVLLYAASIRNQPVDDGLVYEDYFIYNGQTKVVNLPLLEPGDFSLRALVQLVDDNDDLLAPSRSDLDYFRWDGANSVTAYEAGAYTLLRGEELAKTKPGFGIQTQHSFQPTGLASLFAEPQEPYKKETADGLKLNAPKYIIGEGVADKTDRGLESKASATNNKAEYITIVGNLSTDINGINVPLHYTQIDLYDEDLIKDDYLGTVRTDNQGNYNITVKNDDPLSGGIDVYLYIHSQRPKANLLYLVPDGEGGYTPFYYTWRSATHDDLDKPVETINYKINSDNLAATIWSGTSSAIWLTESATGRDLSRVEVRYPPFVEGTFYRNGIINIDPKFGDSPEVVGHEYAHAVMDQAYGGFPDGSGGNHGLCQRAKKGLAWSEGFASWYGVAAWDGDPSLSWHIGGRSISIEVWDCHIHDATIDEFRTATWMWDLYDVPMDDNGGNVDVGKNGYSDNNQGAGIVGTRTLLNTLWKRKQHTTTDYWTDLQTNLTNDEKPPSVRISNYNYLIQ